MLFVHVDAFPGARIAPDPGIPLLHRKGAEAPQLDTVAAGQRLGNLFENRIDDPFDVTLVEMRVFRQRASE